MRRFRLALLFWMALMVGHFLGPMLPWPAECPDFTRVLGCEVEVR
jgi:hypothetical protein